MAVYKSDQQDILFTLNDVLKITQYEKYGFDESSIKEILIEYDKFVASEIYPTRQESDEVGVKMTDEGVKVPECLKSMHQQFYDMGWFALGVSEAIGGTPVPEALSKACFSLGMSGNVAWSMYPGLTKGAMNVMNMVGDSFVKETFIPKIMSGEWGGTMCLTEAGAGSDVGNLKSTAKPIEGKDGWFKIKGTKIFISSGDSDLYKNNIHLVLARTPKGEAGTKGISLFVVPKFKVNADGSLGESNDVNCPSFEHKMGIHASATCVLNFGENDNCEGYLLGEELEGMQNMFIMMNEARLDCGMQGESQANLAYELTKQYVNERVQFGTEIVKLPDVAKTLLKMRAMSRALRAIILYTADLFDKLEADEDLESRISLLTPICKAFCSDQGFNVSVDAIQAHGGYGFCTEYGIEQFARDTKIASIYEGTNGIQAMDFSLRKILKDGGKAYSSLMEEIKASVEDMSSDLVGEKEIFSEALKAADESMQFIGAAAKNKQMNLVLQSTTDFLNLNSHILAAWRLLEAQKVAHTKMKDGSDESEYLESKIVDFKVYVTQYLPHAVALGKSITSAGEDMLTYPI